MIGLAPVLDAGNEIEVEETQIRMNQLVYLLLRELGVAIEVFVSGIDQFENLLTITALENIFLGKLAHMQIVSFLYHGSNLGVFLGHGIRHDELVLYVLVVDLVAIESLYMLGIIGIVVDGGHGAQLVESPGKHAFRIHISKAKRTYHIVHSLRLAIVFYSLQKSLGHFTVVDEVDPAKTHRLAVPSLVGLVVDDSSDTTRQLSVLIGKKIFGLAKLKSGIAVLAEGIHFVAEQVGHIILVALV